MGQKVVAKHFALNLWNFLDTLKIEKWCLESEFFRLLNSFQDEVLEVLKQDQYPTNVDRRGHHFQGDFVK